MKTKLYCAILAFLNIAGVGQAQHYLIIKSMKATVSGTSTFHNWTSTITGTECTCYLQNDELLLKTIRDIQVKIPVKGIKSSEGKIMDEKTYEAFKSDENPYIMFASKDNRYDVSKPFINITGNLIMAGVSRTVTLDAGIKILPNGDMEVSVVKKLKMSEFNMKPPTAILGTISVGDEVTLNFNLILTSENVKNNKPN